MADFLIHFLPAIGLSILILGPPLWTTRQNPDWAKLALAMGMAAALFCLRWA